MFLFGLPGHLDDGRWWMGRLPMLGELQWLNYLLVALGTITLAYAVAPQSVLTWARNAAKSSKSAPNVLGQRNVDFSKPINPEDWEGVEVYLLNEAACLWVDVEPHDPIVDAKAKSQFFRLRSAMTTGKLPYHKGLIRALNEITGEPSLPPGSSILNAISLRRYAESIGDVPTFLQSVKVPVKQETPKEKDAE